MSNSTKIFPDTILWLDAENCVFNREGNVIKWLDKTSGRIIDSVCEVINEQKLLEHK